MLKIKSNILKKVKLNNIKNDIAYWKGYSLASIKNLFRLRLNERIVVMGINQTIKELKSSN